MQEYPLPWNYFNIVKSYLVEADSLLDMGTGGGEFLSNLAPLPTKAYATESYEPNIKLARNNLESYGVKVIPIQDDNNLPFEKNFFQLIIDRHEYFKSSEIKRILKPNGIFITQQVGGMNDCELNEILGAPESDDIGFNLDGISSDLLEADLEILYSNEIKTKTRFYDIGAILYYLKIIDWQIKDFSIEKYENGLKELYREISDVGYIDFTCHRFIVVASKNGLIN